jgi:membrane protein
MRTRRAAPSVPDVKTAQREAQRAADLAREAWTRFQGTLAGRFVAGLVELRVVDRALALASKLFIAILPLSILSTALVSRRSFGDQMVQRFRLTGSGADAAEALFASPSQVQSGVGVIGLVILVSSVLSFARALERVYLDCWDLPATAAALRGRMAWVAGFCLYLALWSGLRALLETIDARRLTSITWAAVGALLFLWTPYVLLGKRVSWRRLLPTAAATGSALLALGVGSAIVLPRIISHNTERYGYIGFAFSMVSWLFTGTVVIIAAAVLGRLVTAEREARVLAGAVQPD